MQLRWIRPDRHGSYAGKYVCETCDKTVVSPLVPSNTASTTADAVS